MIPYNNYDKLNMAKLFIIIQILQQSCFNENIKKTSKKSSTNIKHKNNVTLNNLSVKKNPKDKMNTKCVPPIQEVYIQDDPKCVHPIQEVYIQDDTKCVPSIQEVYIQDDTKCLKMNIKNKDEINNITTNGIYEISGNITTNDNENFISTLPIILAKKTIEVPIESTFKIENATLDIKNMKKHIYLTSSKVLPMY